MENNDTSNQPCIAPGITHNWQFAVAAFGQSCWQCTICGEWDDFHEDGLAG